jgi:pimeloyl-ACP methyl ester carboxylesterase
VASTTIRVPRPGIGVRRASDLKRPSLLYLAAELPRSAAEYGWFQAARPLLTRAPVGDGHHVLVLPGLIADDRSTGPLRWFLRDLGYQVHGWQLGTNLPSPDMAARLRALLDRLHETDPQPLSIVGWSLGGIYARSIARVLPDRIRQVITLGSPFRTLPGHESNAAPIVRAGARIQGLRITAPDGPPGNDEAVPVPSTAIFSRSDGVVPWRACLDTRGGRHETLEVIGSHVGLGHHPAVLWAIADRLSQPEGTWAPMRIPAVWRSVLFPHPGR